MQPLVRVAEVWRFREVIKNFVAQDLKVKYRRSYLGFFWSLLNPLLQMVVLSAVFSLIFRIQNFSLYLLSGLVPWTFFSASVDGCSMSIVAAEGMLRRQYFPKLVFPLSAVIQNLVTFALSLVVLLLILGWVIGFRLSPALLILPVSFLCLFCVALGVGAVAAVVTVYFRDMQHLIAVFTMSLFYLTPILYPLEDKNAAASVSEPAATTQVSGAEGNYRKAEIGDSPSKAAPSPSSAPAETIRGPIPHRYRAYFKLNPLFALIEMFHRPIYDNELPTQRELVTAIGVSVLSLFGGLAIFWRYEDKIIFAL